MGLSKKKEQGYLKKVKENGLYLRRIETDQTPEICLEAVKENPDALEYVKEQTFEICLEAIKQHGHAIRLVKEQTEEICIEAIKRDISSLVFIRSQTFKICWEAVRQNGSAIKYVKNQTDKLCLEAIKSNAWAFRYVEVEKRKPEICLIAVLNESSSYEFIENPTEEMEKIHEIFKNNFRKSYRQIRSELTNKEINLTDSPYHVLEQLYYQ